MVLLIHSTTLFGIAHQLLLSASDAEYQGGSVLSLERRHTGVLSTDGGFVFIGDAYTYNALDLQWTCGPKRLLRTRLDQTLHRRLQLVKACSALG